MLEVKENTVKRNVIIGIMVFVVCLFIYAITHP